MFIDKVQIKIKGGNGGNGCVSFYRAKYVTSGGPDGGDGGKGGDVSFVARSGINTLLDFRHRKLYKASPGEDGTKRNCSGKNGESILIEVPQGTIIRDAESGKIIADMSVIDEEKVIIRGGKGGKGNQHFATPSRQAPRYAERGRLSKEMEIILELKLIADVGIIGLPNVGKSTLLSMVTNANPKIANYHFTTLAPNLGVVRSKYGEDFVMADIPGLIEGASKGEGLGHDFLRHIERTKAFIHVVDASGCEDRDPIEDIIVINKELEQYNENLLKRPQIIAANKMDIPEAKDNFEKIFKKFESDSIKVIPISAATKTGLDDLIMEINKIISNYPEDIIFEPDYEEYVMPVEDNEPFTIKKAEEGYFIVTGTGVEKMIGYTSIDTEKGFAFFQKYLRDKGIIAKLEEMGIEDGDTVSIYNLMFDYYK